MLLMLDYIICISLFCGILVQAPNPILDKGEVLNGYVETTESELGVSLELVDEKDLKNRPMIEANNTEYELGTSLLSLTGEIVPCRSKQATPVKKSALLQGLYDERSDCSPKCFGRKRPQSLLLTSDPYNFSESEECNVDLHTSFRQEYSFFRTSTPKKLRTYEKKLQNQDNFTIEVEGELGTSLTELDDSISLMPEMPTPVKTKGQIISNKSLEELIMDDSVQKEITARKDKSNSLLEKAIESSVDCIMNARLCKHECLVSFSFDAVKELRYKLWTKDYRRRVEWFHDYYTAADTIQGQLFFTVIKGKRVCSKCFRDMFKINKNFFFTWKRRFELGAISTGFRRGRSVSKSSDEAEIWLQEYARFRGDSLPDRAITQLPYKTRKNDVYECYKDEKLMNDEIFVSRSQFYSLWKTKFKHLQIKQTNSFSRCETCTTLSTRLEKTRNKDERQELKKNILVHNNRQMAERKYYYAKRKRSEENKRQYLSLIIDGMDQSKTNLPHFTGRRSKGLDAAHLLQTHVQGIINHGLNRITTFVDINEYSHDSNLIMNTLLKEIYDTSIHMGSYLPETIYIQADNCFRENKNRYVLSFCELLVRKNVFKEVHLSFLYVGHTHEDIDASFSKIAEKLRKHDAETFPDLMALLPNSKETRGLYDIKGWLEKEINPIKGHTTPLHFKFSRNENEKFQCEYKKNNNVSWKKMERPLLNKIPSGIPKILEPSNLKKIDFGPLEKNIEKCRFLFTDIVQEKEYKWWKQYIKHLKEVVTQKEKMSLYSKKNARWLLPLLPKRSDRIIQPSSLLPTEIQEMVDKELDEPQVHMPMPKRKKTCRQKKNNKNSNQKRKRIIYFTYVYGYTSSKNQMCYWILWNLCQLLFILCGLYLLATGSIIHLSVLINYLLSANVNMKAQQNAEAYCDKETFLYICSKKPLNFPVLNNIHDLAF